MKPAIILVFLLTANFFTFFGIMVYLTQGDSEITQVVFLKYTWSQPFFASLKYLLIVTIYLTVPFQCISNSESFEDFECLKKCLKNEQGELQRWPIVILRLIMLVICIAFLMASSWLNQLFTLGGAFFTPAFLCFPVKQKKLNLDNFEFFVFQKI